MGSSLFAIAISSCEHNNREDQNPRHLTDFPEFITPNEKYFKINIAGNHTIDGSTYRLKNLGEQLIILPNFLLNSYSILA